MEAVLEEFKKAETKFNIKLRVILCCIRSLPGELCYAMLSVHMRSFLFFNIRLFFHLTCVGEHKLRYLYDLLPAYIPCSLFFSITLRELLLC